jgi:hypothetical protein
MSGLSRRSRGSALLANYDLLAGRTWPIVLAFVAASPFLWRPHRHPHFAPHGA